MTTPIFLEEKGARCEVVVDGVRCELPATFVDPDTGKQYCTKHRTWGRLDV